MAKGIEKKKAVRLLELFRLIKKLDEEDLKTFFEHLSEDSLLSLCDAVFNCISGSEGIVPVSEQEKVRPDLIQHKCALRFITNYRKPIEKRRQKFIQVGGGIATIAALLIPLITGLLNS